ncbi:MAG: hypothetical protein ACE5GT_01095 [Rhodospirillales bacterium]
MVRPAWFLGLSVIFVAGIFLVDDYVPESDPFSLASQGTPVYLDGFSNQSLAWLKRNHARRFGRYDIGVFGNSRSLDIAKADIGVDGCTFFNFSIGGGSLRSAIAYLELLARDGVPPRVAAISVDNFELQRYNNPFFLPAWPRWRLLARDLREGLSRESISARELLKMGWRHALTEFIIFKRNFGVEPFLRGARDFLGLAPGQSAGIAEGATYRADGSRATPPATSDQHPEGILSPGSPQILFGYLRYDLERLKRLQEQGVRVILYETMLEPKSARVFNEKPSAYAAATRLEFKSLCGELSLHCVTAPGEIPFNDLPWQDYSHPPAKSTGVHLTGLLRGDGSRCDHDI